MKNIYPDFYNSFKCIASDCPDSCCKDWDVVVDDNSADFYNSLQGDFGDKLRNKMTIDSDGDRIFVLRDGSCPFWNKNHLCDIFINIGEEHLCKTCRQFPRLTQNYTVFSEHMLSFACPEAAKIMMKTNDFLICFSPFEISGDINDLGYSDKLMNSLILRRKKSADIFIDTGLQFSKRLSACLEYNNQFYKNGTHCNQYFNGTDAIFDLFKKLDIMNSNWLYNLQNSKNSVSAQNIEIDKEFTNLALYYLFRYYLGAIDDGNILFTIQRIALAYIIISKMITYNSAENDFHKRVMLFQQYSKEIEHSYENSEALESKFAFDPAFSAEGLIKILNSI